MTRYISAFLVACVLALLSATVSAQSKLTFVPSASVSSVYDDNIFAKAVGSADQMMLITPALETTYETPVTMLFGSYTFDVQRSLANPTLSTLHARRHATVDSKFQVTPRLTFGLGGRYDRTDGAAEFQRFTGVLLDRRRAERWEAGPSFSYKPSSRTNFNGLFNWINETVEDSVGGSEQVARLGVTRQTTPRSTFGVSALGRRFVSADEAIVPSGLPTSVIRGNVYTSHDGYQVVRGGTFVSLAPLVAYTYEVAPATTITVQAGPRYSSALDAFVPEVAAGFGRKAPNIFGYSFDYWRGESIILGVLGPVEVDSATAKFTVPIRTNLEVGVHGGLFNSQTLSQGNVRVYHAEIVGSWTTKGLLTIAASYGTDFQHGDVRSSLLSDREVVRHVILLRLTAAPRLSKSFKPDDPLQPLGVPTKGVK